MHVLAVQVCDCLAEYFFADGKQLFTSNRCALTRVFPVDDFDGMGALGRTARVLVLILV